MCSRQRLAGELATAESVTAKDSNYVNIFGLDFAFSFAITILIRLLIARGNISNANILSLIAFIISYCLFADKLVYALNRATVVLIIILFIPITKIRDPLLKTTDTLHLLLKGLVMKILDFMQDMLDDIYPGSRKTWDNSTILLIAVVSLLFVLKAPFALHFICAVCDLVTLAQYKSYDEDTLAYIQGALERINHALTHIIQDIRMYGALDGICTGANSEAYYITMVKQFYSMTNKKEYILQICLHNSQRTALLAADYATVVKQRIQPYLIKLPLSEVAVNIVISNFIYAAAVFQFSGKRHNDPEYCNKEVVRYRRDYVWVQEFKHGDNRRQSRTVTDNRKHIAYIEAFSEVLLFNNNGQIDNTTGMLSVPFKFYDLSTIICLVHLVLRDLPDLTTYKYNCLYLLIFDINLLRTLREYRQKRT
ncbi:hypothetical protein HBI60_077850 [Parastagonospora nodorum]|nr:hypothetical protein HBI60_077850 [Parastagonospora nodorum]